MSQPGPMPMTLKVRNFLGIKRADLPIKGITLVAGLNGAGKTGLLDATACGALPTHSARGLLSRKAAAELLHRGAEAGSVTFDYGVGSVRVSYPDAAIERTGRPEAMGTPLGIGATRLMSLAPADRTREVAERFHTTPVLDDLVEWFRDHPAAGLDADMVRLVWEGVEEHGWEAHAKRAKEHGQKLKGRWEVVTARRWGTEIARTWCPNNLLPGEEYTEEEAVARVATAKSRLEELVRFEAVGSVDKERLEERAGGIEALRTQMKQLVADETTLAAEVEAVIKQRNASDAPVDTSACPECPHCARKIRLIRSGSSEYITLEKAPKALAPEALQEARMRIAAMDGAVQNTKNRLTGNNQARIDTHRALSDAEAARADLLRMQKLPQVDEAEVSRARSTVLELERRLDSIKAYLKAIAIREEWYRHEGIIDALEPDGVRKMVMGRRLSEICAELSRWSAKAMFSEVALTPDLDATYDGRRYALLSESERWRVDLVLCAALGRAEGARLILVDRLDVLHPQARPGVLMLLKALDVPALIGMTARDPASLPALEKMHVGVCRWLDAGVLAALEPKGGA